MKKFVKTRMFKSYLLKFLIRLVIFISVFMITYLMFPSYTLADDIEYPEESNTIPINTTNQEIIETSSNKEKKLNLNSRSCILYDRTSKQVLFGKNEYKNLVYFNTFNSNKVKEILKNEKSIEKIVIGLSLLSGETILPNDTLMIFDNVNDLEDKSQVVIVKVPPLIVKVNALLVREFKVVQVNVPFWKSNVSVLN